MVRLVVNGLEVTGYTVTKLSSEYSGNRTFVTPRELLEGDVVNFRTMTDVSDRTISSSEKKRLIQLGRDEALKSLMKKIQSGS